MTMAFGIMSFFDKDKDDYVSPGSIGGKIKMYRELRGWSQKQLGIKCGFSPSTADVRIAQYEKNRKIPREKALRDIANALEISEFALFDADLMLDYRMFHALFDIEDFHGLHPVKKEDGYYLEFSGPTLLNNHKVSRLDYSGFLKYWYEMRQKCMPDDNGTSELDEEKVKEYTLWRGEYPDNIDENVTEELNDMMKMDHLQAEMDALNAKMKGKEELSKIDKAIEIIMPDVRSVYKPIILESELIYLVKRMLEKGLPVKRHLHNRIDEKSHGSVQLLSIKTDAILGGTDDAKSLFAEFVCAIETIQNYGIDISTSIRCLKNEFYITYSYPFSNDQYFKNLYKYWDKIDFIASINDDGADPRIPGLEDELRKAITGEADVRLDQKVAETNNQ